MLKLYTLFINGKNKTEIYRQWVFIQRCLLRHAWLYCTYFFVIKLDVIVASKGDLDKTYSVMIRDDDPSASEELHRKDTGMFATILGGSHSYTLHWTNQVPEEIQINSYGIEK